ncbi:isochorismatase family protein [Bradyrhizobium paxllaeri]|uniref:isochorismatase family protein n=1 Tax=Bradyrhizobium paxllaeri TaxID=190148 RepID=UPI000810CCBA|nr:isochorismatase family protein [Bradyrhizobium paxllaeri]
MVLINMTRGKTPDSAGLAPRHVSFSLLQTGLEMFGVASTVIGECQPFEIMQKLVHSTTQLDVDAVSIWRDPRFTDNLASRETGIIFFGGGWLEEDIFIAALQAVERGYDVRLLSDLIATRVDADRSLALDRMALHGILATTVRQMLLEWAVCLHDPLLTQKVQQLLL